MTHLWIVGMLFNILGAFCGALGDTMVRRSFTYEGSNEDNTEGSDESEERKSLRGDTNTTATSVVMPLVVSAADGEETGEKEEEELSDESLKQSHLTESYYHKQQQYDKDMVTVPEGGEMRGRANVVEDPDNEIEEEVCLVTNNNLLSSHQSILSTHHSRRSSLVSIASFVTPPPVGGGTRARTFWSVGMVLTMVVNPFCTLTALSFIPATVVTSFAGIHILFAMILAKFWLREHVTVYDVCGAVLVIAGIVVIIIFTGKQANPLSYSEAIGNLTSTSSTLYITMSLLAFTLGNVLLSDYLSSSSACCCCASFSKVALPTTAGLMGGCANIAAKIMMVGFYPKRSSSSALYATTTSSDQIDRHQLYNHNSLLVENMPQQQQQSINKLSMREGSRHEPQQLTSPFGWLNSGSRPTPRFLSFLPSSPATPHLPSASSFSSWFAGSADCPTNDISGGATTATASCVQWWVIYLVVAVVFISASADLVLLNRSLKLYNAVVVVPVVYSVLISSGALGALLVLQEYPSSPFGFIFGLLLVLFGIVMLSFGKHFADLWDSSHRSSSAVYEQHRASAVSDGSSDLMRTD
eukprot:GHVS01056229.1.p1 GENE.GHVS01056229.1~~GHVS01056229.1.p1  ORF type:complete len:582 (+),score=113.65 GHVS01056229.1:232-1977(+)